MEYGPDGINIFNIDWDDPVAVAGLRAHVEAEAAKKDPEWWEANKDHADDHWQAAMFVLGM